LSFSMWPVYSFEFETPVLYKSNFVHKNCTLEAIPQIINFCTVTIISKLKEYIVKEFKIKYVFRLRPFELTTLFLYFLFRKGRERGRGREREL